MRKLPQSLVRPSVGLGGWGGGFLQQQEYQHREGKKYFSSTLLGSQLVLHDKRKTNKKKQKFINMYISYIHGRLRDE